MEWTEPKFSKTQVDKAGASLLAGFMDFENVLEVIRDWRTSHYIPMTILAGHIESIVRRFDERAITASRIKRLASIEQKLRRMPRTRLSQLQDIGGCRVITGSIEQTSALVTELQNSGIASFDFVSKDDYIASPKRDGYRSVHLIYAYNEKRDLFVLNRDFSRPAPLGMFNGRKIELQIRSRLQHAWATAVETIETFTRIPLKSLGEKTERDAPTLAGRWKRFLALASEVLAKNEKTPSVDVATANVVSELVDLSKKLRVVVLLESWMNSIESISQHGQALQSDLVLLEMNPTEHLRRATFFFSGQTEQAFEAYQAREREVRDNTDGAQVALVSTNMVQSLKDAYPNYFADTTEFLGIVREAIALN